MKIERVYWFTGDESIGIVVGKDQITGERKGYISTVRGRDEDEDKEYIAACGQRIQPAVMRQIADYLEAKPR